jgi:membrane-bound metal-dependent hydrolase YbcI (DUF457 family)
VASLKLVAHVASGYAVAYRVAVLLGRPGATAIASAVLAALYNVVIDVLGHERVGRYVARKPSTHSLLGALVAPFALAAILAAAGAPVSPIAVAAGSAIHLLLDAVTESGVYLAWPASRRRYALAHIRYNSPLANTLAVAASLALLAAPPSSPPAIALGMLITWMAAARR